jgi:hypothetical protein
VTTSTLPRHDADYSCTHGHVSRPGRRRGVDDEEKYRWRRAVCDQEWDETAEDRRRTKRSKRGKNQTPTKVKQVRTEPADLANTVLKMATKRSLVAAVLTVTAASDIFAEYTEDPDGADARNQRRGQQAAQNARGRSTAAQNSGPGRKAPAAQSGGGRSQSAAQPGGAARSNDDAGGSAVASNRDAVPHADESQFDAFQNVTSQLGMSLEDKRELLRGRNVERFSELTYDAAFDLLSMLDKELRERSRPKQDGALFAE